MPVTIDTVQEARNLLTSLFGKALEAVRGDHLVECLGPPTETGWFIRKDGQAIDWPIDPRGRLIVIGAGKAAAAMAQGIETLFGDRIDDGCIIVKRDHRGPLRRIRQLEAGHPLPDEAGVAATAELLRAVNGLTRRDSVIVLLSGGASALLVAPAPGITLSEKSATTDLLLRSGASIEEINCVRKRLSRVKGGLLLDHIAPAACLTLLLSDVPSGDHGSIGSGPTIRPSSGRSSSGGHDPLEIIAHYGLLDHIPSAVRALLAKPQASVPPREGGRADVVLLGDSGSALAAVRQAARDAGLRFHVVNPNMTGHTHVQARSMAEALRRCPAARRPALFMSAGETTLHVTGDGKGGRNQEFALVAALALEGVGRVALLSAGTDGTDGPTDAAGAFADGSLVARAQALGLEPIKMLARNDSYTLFDRTQDLLRTGSTGTNVMDLVLGIAF
ncbi:glycerate kinase [Sphingobium sp.]|uniref:glycerate kinase n=1 Tax=Sphingobium sp. TaxID=1912891 RepID=UPI0035C6F45C